MKRITQLAISGISSLGILGFFQPAQAGETHLNYLDKIPY